MEAAPLIDLHINRPWVMCCKINIHIWLAQTCDIQWHTIVFQTKGQRGHRCSQRHRELGDDEDEMFSWFVRWKQEENELNQKIIFCLSETSHMKVSGGWFSLLQSYRQHCSVSLTPESMKCVIDPSAPPTRTREDSWGAADVQSTHELVEWGKPITLCDRELWHESESGPEFFFPTSCLHVVFSTWFTEHAVCRWTEWIWSSWFQTLTSIKLVWERWCCKHDGCFIVICWLNVRLLHVLWSGVEDTS